MGWPRSIKEIESASAGQRAVILALLAVGSAVLSTYLSRDPWSLSVVFKGKPTLPGVYFGLVLSVATFWWATKNPFKILTVLFVTVIAWLVAQEVGERAYSFIDSTIQQSTAGVSPIEHQSTRIFPLHVNYSFAVSGVVAGFVGAFVTVFGVSLACKDFRNFRDWAATILVGTVAGSLLEMAIGKGTPPLPNSLSIHIGSLLPLYLVWQSCVAASIGYGLRSGNR
jgi:hypothetical protein